MMRRHYSSPFFAFFRFVQRVEGVAACRRRGDQRHERYPEKRFHNGSILFVSDKYRYIFSKQRGFVPIIRCKESLSLVWLTGSVQVSGLSPDRGNVVFYMDLSGSVVRQRAITVTLDVILGRNAELPLETFREVGR